MKDKALTEQSFTELKLQETQDLNQKISHLREENELYSRKIQELTIANLKLEKYVAEKENNLANSQLDNMHDMLSINKIGESGRKSFLVSGDMDTDISLDNFRLNFDHYGKEEEYDGLEAK